MGRMDAEWTKPGPSDAAPGRVKRPGRLQRLFRFRLRTLVAFVTLLAVLLGAYRIFVAPYLRQNEIRLAIEAAGGSYEAKPAPAWLAAVFGEDNVCVLTKVDLARFDDYRGYEFGFRSFPYAVDIVSEPSPALLEQIKDLTDLEALNVAGQDVDDNLVAAWDDLDKLKSLNLAETLVRDPRCWPEFPLTALDLEGVFIGDKHAAALTRYPNLKSLNLARLPLSDAGLARLKPLNKLADLSLQNTAVTHASLDTLKSFSHLDRLDVGRPEWQPATKTVPFVLTNAETSGDGLQIEINTAGIEAARADLQTRIDKYVPGDAEPLTPICLEGFHLELLAGTETIQELDLSLAFLRVEDLQVLPTLPNLTRLSFLVAKIDEEAWGIIAKCPMLEVVYLDYAGITDAGLRRLVECSSLRAMILTATQITDDGLACLAERPELEYLDLSQTAVTNAGLRHLQALPNLEEIRLSTRIRGPGLRHLQKLPKLQVVHFATPRDDSAWRIIPRTTEPPLTAEEINDFAALARSLTANANHAAEESTVKWWQHFAEDLPYPGQEQAMLHFLLVAFELTDEAKQRLPDRGVAWETIRKAEQAEAARL